MSPLPLPAVTVTSPPLSLSAPSSSSTPPSSSRVSGEKRGKESSDEDGEEKKAEVAATQSMIEEYSLKKSKRQKLKEKKERRKQRVAEADLRPIMPDEEEQQRVEFLCRVKPTQDDIYCAERGLPSANPMLLQFLARYDENLRALLTEHAPPFALPLVRRLFLSPAPFTRAAITAAMEEEITVL